MAACTASSDPERGSLVTVLDPNWEAIFNPSWDMPAKFLLFLPLVAFDEHGRIEPRLARRWEHSPDRRRWTYHLRTDVRWHDGVPVTARDVAFSMRLMARPEILYFPDLDSAVVHDDSTLTIHMGRPHYGEDWWVVFYPQHLLDTLDAAKFFQWDFWTHPVGNGPYRYVRHVPRTVWEMEANADYYAGKPRIERVRFKFGGGSPVVELESGQVDVVTYLSRTDVPRLRGDPRFRVYHWLYPDVAWVEGIHWNHRNPLFRDRAVRRALTMAIDRAELKRVLYLPDTLPIFDVLFSGRQFWAGRLPAPLPYDPGAARRLLAAAGWRDADGDGIVDREGRSFRFTILVEAGGAAATSAWATAAVYMQAAFREVGVDMRVQTMRSGVIQRLRAGEFDAVVTSFFRQSAPRVFAEIGYDDPAILARVREAASELDAARADSLFTALAPTLARDIPITFFAPNAAAVAAHRRVRGLVSPFRADPVVHMEFLWVDDR